MNIDTGKIYNYVKKEELEKALEELNMMKINTFDMTAKQKENMQVSLHDNKSKLGKLRIKESTLRNRKKRAKNT